MRLEKILLAITMLLFLSPAKLVATTDGTINLYERPSLLLNEALSKAKEALGRDGGRFTCTEAQSKTRKSGGGWRFVFQSSTLNTRYVEINKSGKVVDDGETAPTGGQFKTPPSLSIGRAMAFAIGTRDRPGGWLSLHADWREKPNEWCVYLVNAHRDVVYIHVDSKGNTREQKVSK
jgi:hypothetical protein